MLGVVARAVESSVDDLLHAVQQRTRECGGCHSDYHKGGLGKKCEACHTAVEWKPATKTLKQHKLDMNDGHAGLQCVQCLLKGSHLTAQSSCGDCHDDKWKKLSAGVHQRVSCEICHGPGP